MVTCSRLVPIGMKHFRCQLLLGYCSGFVDKDNGFVPGKESWFNVCLHTPATQCLHGGKDEWPIVSFTTVRFFYTVTGWHSITMTHCRLFERKGMGFSNTGACPICHTPEMYTLFFLIFCFSLKLLKTVYPNDLYFCGNSLCYEWRVD